MSYLTPEAKLKLSNTIRQLRERLLTDLHNAVDSTYRLSLPFAQAGLAEMRLMGKPLLVEVTIIRLKFGIWKLGNCSALLKHIQEQFGQLHSAVMDYSLVVVTVTHK
ncbi:MAG: hypothetical protein SAK29_23705 [Scytonema sp. PMC 1069.18]|nr:hypothetical protein [Scytonema sp. PMC 1069.18]MEC4880144.1 hypothetical protein [Scytonema sp. PMC 1070.18]